MSTTNAFYRTLSKLARLGARETLEFIIEYGRRLEVMAAVDLPEDGVCRLLLDSVGRVVAANEEAGAWLALPADGIEGLHLGHLFPPEVVAGRMRHLEAVASSGRTERFFDVAEGVPVDVAVVPVPGFDGGVTGFVMSWGICLPERTWEYAGWAWMTGDQPGDEDESRSGAREIGAGYKMTGGRRTVRYGK